MSAIAGVIHIDQSLCDLRLVEKLTIAMHRRGPDAVKHWSGGAVSLGHCMLRTTPESLHETQPTKSPDNALVIVMDGRLDNRAELRSQLRAQYSLPKDAPDAQFVLLGYERWGRGVPQHLLGDFVFAIWDHRRNELFCARDHMGVKPFYYHLSDRLFGFASDHEALLKLPSVSAAPNEDRIAGVLAQGFTAFDPSVSWLAEVNKLEPGTAMTVSLEGRLTVERYWQLEAPQQLQLRDDRAYLEAFDSVFRDAVDARMRSAGPIGLMLSGGIDSGAIAAAAGNPRINAPALCAYSFTTSRSKTCEETENIQQVVAKMQLSSNQLSIDELATGAFDETLESELWWPAHPVRQSLPLPLLMYSKAAADGCRVVLDGMDGDLVSFSSPYYIASVIRSLQWGTAWKEIRAAATNNTVWCDVSKRRILYENAVRALLPMPAKRWKRRYFPTDPIAASSVIDPDFAEQIGLRERMRAWDSSAHSVCLPDSISERIAVATCAPGARVGFEGMELLADRWAIEARHPWSDRRLIEFFLSLPRAQRVRAGWTKYLVRNWAAPHVGKAAAWHSGKNHLGYKVAERALKCAGQRVELLHTAANSPLAPYCNIEAVRAVARKARADSGSPSVWKMYELMGLAVYLARIASAKSNDNSI